MAEIIAVTEIQHGDGKDNNKVFSVGEKITGLPVDQVKLLLSVGAAVKVEKAVKVESEDPTVKRDTIMVMAGQYPSTIDRPAAVGRVPVNVVSSDEAERIEALEKANKELRAAMDKEKQQRAEEASKLAALEAENKTLTQQLQSGTSTAK